VFMALIAAATAWCLALALRRVVPPGVAVCGALVWLTLPLSLAFGGSVMTEMPLALAMAVMLACWPAVAADPRVLGGALLGGAMGWALLVKSSAASLLAVPALVGGRLLDPRRVRAAVLTIGVAVIIGGPWAVIFREQARAGWLYPSPTLAFTWPAIPFYVDALRGCVGWSVVAGAALWLVSAVRLRGSISALERACVVASAASVALPCVVPAGLDIRHVLPATVPVTALAMIGGWRAWQGARWPVMRAMTAAGLVVVALTEAWAGLPTRRIEGYADMVSAIGVACGPGCVVLVVSDPEGEGAFVAEAARVRRPVPMIVLRGSKVLSASDWAGRNYRPLVRSAGEGRRLLKNRHVQIVVVDTAAVSTPDHAIARGALLAPGDRALTSVATVRVVSHPGARQMRSGALVAYDVGAASSPGPAGRLPKQQAAPAR